jgi:hypothetical protein
MKERWTNYRKATARESNRLILPLIDRNGYILFEIISSNSFNSFKLSGVFILYFLNKGKPILILFPSLL